MKLTDFDSKKHAEVALKENFEINFEMDKLDKKTTRNMLQKVTSLIKEAKTSSNFSSQKTEQSYMKLVFMEQALIKHWNNVSTQPTARIVVENEQVEKSQVILAAQDLVDSIQKMYETVNDMLVKELPALVDSIQSEIGVNESQTFASEAGDSLSTLNNTLQETRSSLQSALGVVTGQEETVDPFSADDLDTGDELEPDLDDTDLDDTDLELPVPAPTSDEDEMIGVPGREKR